VGEEALSPFETLRCTVEVVSWVTKFIGGAGAGRKEFEEPFVPGETVREVLGRFSRRYPELDAALWDASKQGLGEHIEVMVNDAVLGVSHTLDSPLGANDRITLLGQYMGG
jgi:molybdopterin converting factor small subunit